MGTLWWATLWFTLACGRPPTRFMVKEVQAIAHGYGRDVVGWEEIWDHFG